MILFIIDIPGWFVETFENHALELDILSVDDQHLQTERVVKSTS